MAIDNPKDRKSAAGMYHVGSGPGMTPDATQDEQWRRDSGYSWSGLIQEAADFYSALLGHTNLIPSLTGHTNLFPKLTGDR